jgi:outer membrane protein assembly factor BamB
MAYADGIVYVPVVNLGAWVTPTWSESLEFSEGTGEMVALNVGNGSVLWSTQFDSMVFGAATVVNDLVFTSTFDGMIYALNRETGKEVWSYQAPAGINAWPAVAGDTIIFPAGVEIGMGQPVLIAFRIGATE